MKLHLRDLFWLVFVVGLGLAWWIDNDRIRRQEQVVILREVKAKKAAEAADAWVMRMTGALQGAQEELNVAREKAGLRPVHVGIPPLHP